MADPSVDDLLDLVGVLVGALDAAAMELIGIEEAGDYMDRVPEDVRIALEEREALAGTLKWIASREALPDGMAEAARAEYVRLRGEVEMPEKLAEQIAELPVLDEPKRVVEQALESVRRARLFDRRLDVVLHGM